MTDPALAFKTEHGRFYRHPRDKNTVPSITNIKDMKAIKGLPAWAARECADYAADNITHLASLPRDDIFRLVKGAPYRRDGGKASPALIGDIVHEWVDQEAKGLKVDTTFYLDREGEPQKPPQSALWIWNSYGSIRTAYTPRWLKSEFTVWSYEYGYAGTADLVGYVHNHNILDGNKVTLVDTKTGKNAYDDMAIQLAAISHAECIVDANGNEIPLPKIEQYAIMHLRPRYAEMIPVSPETIEYWWRAFLGLKLCFDAVNKCENTTLLYTPKLEVRVA